MTIIPDLGSPKLVELLTGGGIGVLLTDTIYGIVACANDETAVARVFAAKQRNPEKPPIVLISSVDQLFDPLSADIDATIDGLWPGPNSIILPAPSAPAWLVRGSQGVSYRLPSHPRLCQLIAQTGPLIAPSANPEGQPPARTIGEAQGYFGETVDFYVDGGVAMNDKPSSLYSLIDTSNIEQLR